MASAPLARAGRIAALWFRACSALALASAGGARARKLRAEVARLANALAAERWAASFPNASFLRAGLARLGNEHERARTLLESAATGYEATDMILYAKVARRCLGAVTGGDEGRAMIEASDAWMRDQAVQSPAHMAAMIAPSFARS